jgi:hypothetical protein
MTDEVYDNYKGKLQRISYIYKNDLKKYDNFESLFAIDQRPFIVDEMFSGNVTLETATILDVLVNYITPLDKMVTDNFIWPDQKKRILDYKAFVPLWINIKNMKKITKELFTTCG